VVYRRSACDKFHHCGRVIRHAICVQLRHLLIVPNKICPAHSGSAEPALGSASCIRQSVSGPPPNNRDLGCGVASAQAGNLNRTGVVLTCGKNGQPRAYRSQTPTADAAAQPQGSCRRGRVCRVRRVLRRFWDRISVSEVKILPQKLGLSFAAKMQSSSSVLKKPQGSAEHFWRPLPGVWLAGLAESSITMATEWCCFRPWFCAEAAREKKTEARSNVPSRLSRRMKQLPLIGVLAA